MNKIKVILIAVLITKSILCLSSGNFQSLAFSIQQQSLPMQPKFKKQTNYTLKNTPSLTLIFAKREKKRLEREQTRQSKEINRQIEEAFLQGKPFPTGQQCSIGVYLPLALKKKPQNIAGNIHL